VTSLVEILTMVSSGAMPLESARGVIAAAFPLLTPEQITDMLQPLVGFEPVAAAAPTPPQV
jgi:hypothetical protein